MAKEKGVIINIRTKMEKQCLWKKCENKVPTNYFYIQVDGKTNKDFCSESCMFKHIGKRRDNQ